MHFCLLSRKNWREHTHTPLLSNSKHANVNVHMKPEMSLTFKLELGSKFISSLQWKQKWWLLIHQVIILCRAGALNAKPYSSKPRGSEFRLQAGKGSNPVFSSVSAAALTVGYCSSSAAAHLCPHLGSVPFRVGLRFLNGGNFDLQEAFWVVTTLGRGT